jgi:multidrug efflux system outer membrane protein
MMMEQQLVSANAQVGVARAMMLPTIGISANLGYSYTAAGIISSAVGNLIAPIFSFGKLKAGLRRSQAVKEEMLITYQKTIYNGLREVADGIISVEKQKEAVAANVYLLSAAQTAFDLSNQLYNAGYASYLDLLNSQRTLYEAQTSLSRAQNSELQSIVSLYLALGGGWK